MRTYQIEKDVPELLAAARNVASIKYIEDEEIIEPLTRFLSALNSEAQLNEAGALGMEKRLIRMLANRLRMLRDFQTHPEIDDQEIVAPVFLTGAGRTGSTKLHKLLAASGGFLYMPFWQGFELGLRTGDRNEDPAPRIRDAQEHVTWFNHHAPRARSIHEYAALEPEEETLLMEHGNISGFMFAFVHCPSFIEWVGPRFPETMKFVKQALKYLQWQFHDGDPRPWVLKCPSYFGGEPLLAELFPDATFVATHRDPLKVLSSAPSLLSAYHEAYSDVQRKEDYGAVILTGNIAGSQRFVQSRRDNPDLITFDVSYTELTADAIPVIEKIYQLIGKDFTPDERRKVLQWEVSNAQHKHGVHSHFLEEFGINGQAALLQMSEYIDEYSKFF